VTEHEWIEVGVVVASVTAQRRLQSMGRMPHYPQFPDEPDFLGLTVEEAMQLAAERRFELRLNRALDNIDPERVTAEVEDGVIVRAQRY
jgi:hypothetical protein